MNLGLKILICIVIICIVTTFAITLYSNNNTKDLVIKYGSYVDKKANNSETFLSQWFWVFNYILVLLFFIGFYIIPWIIDIVCVAAIFIFCDEDDIFDSDDWI